MTELLTPLDHAASGQARAPPQLHGSLFPPTLTHLPPPLLAPLALFGSFFDGTGGRVGSRHFRLTWRGIVWNGVSTGEHQYQ
ncbi:MAG: hypothetical protein R3175_07275 [Marinobacter sp.]|uniref:hypothetical protein n=1 Tax=Marinobacter sp. TaxID=50741 RepID=UPI00299D711F|nr:hypothetical protein [Marinobacter sp.]MDX1755842.1 hypothetical protein [Marinobacter sp.]